MNSVIILMLAAACTKVSAYVTYPGFYVYGTGIRYPTQGVPVTGTGPAVGTQGLHAGHSGPMVAAATGTYQGSLAYPVVLPSGFLLDTPEVAAVKAAHLNAIRNTRAAIVRSAGTYGPAAGVYSSNGAAVYAPGAGVYSAGNYGNGQYAYQG